MGCPCELHLEAETPSIAQAAAKIARDEVERLDRKYSHYRNDSLIARIGALAGSGESLQVDDETANLLDFSAALHLQSQGLFDITAGALTRLWDLQSGKIPPADEIESMRLRVGWPQVQWQRPNLYLPIAGMTLDFGGLVKEYAADRAAALCREFGVRHGVVDLGGDLALIGAHADGRAWLVGIKSPQDRQTASARIELTLGGLATSGDYERTMVIEGRRYSHIINPFTGYPVQSFASVSVVADNCLVAGACATLAMLMGNEKGLAWLATLKSPHFCITADGSILGTLACIE